MNATRLAIAYVIDNWHRAGKVVSFAEYRRRRWLAKHVRPMPPKDAA